MNINNLIKWYNNKNINPKTNRKISSTGNIFKKLQTEYRLIFPNEYNYLDSIFHIDPISREPIWEIENGNKIFIYKYDYNNLILYKDPDNHIICFEKETLKYLKKYKIFNHPITNRPIPLNILNENDLNGNHYNENDNIYNINSETLKVFLKLNNLSIFINHNEFLNLTENNLEKLYYETKEFYYNNIPTEYRLEEVFNIDLDEFKQNNFCEKQKIIIKNYLNILDNSSDNVKYLITYIIVGGLGIVNTNIKKLYPDFSFNF